MSEKLKSFVAIVSRFHIFSFPSCLHCSAERSCKYGAYRQHDFCNLCLLNCVRVRNSTNNEKNKWMSYNAVVLVSLVWQQTNDFDGMPIEWKSDTCRVLNHIDMTVFGRSTNKRSPNVNVWVLCGAMRETLRSLSLPLRANDEGDARRGLSYLMRTYDRWVCTIEKWECCERIRWTVSRLIEFNFIVWNRFA